MPPKAPSYGSHEYWDARFTANANPFEWLEAPNVLDPYLSEALRATTDSDPRLLHIGCGTSLLSFHLRAHVNNPGTIHNVDYSEVAVRVGRQREVDLFKAERASHQDQTPFQPSYMRWSGADLLNPSSLLKACPPSTYSTVVDKSTSDSIACSDDLYVPLPYHITISPKLASPSALTLSPEPIHPLHVLAIHLALVTKPKARWVSLSYSNDRYPGFPDPSLFWKLVGKYDIEPPPPAEPPNDNNGTTTVHRPKVFHWIYVMERTDVNLYVRK
ncbi:hypothetical protein K458DRAFT_438773 [Lentithecium fluviatile CBS 122367]|uniref:Methyltransferase domain-containing protein n=1 Tax=Lentithecium fluviatile CBS 122367 TaxID=1168545 RepID=A0A6G1JLN4_9PLEO|nr:hypothetical protein K458DRAFT_438773 [Lentithecium fluviatile CBS 122367]